VDLTKQSAPKFSMRPKNEPLAQQASPAPGVYDIKASVGSTSHPLIQVGPQWHFGNKNKDLVSQTPAPGEYNVNSEDKIGRVDKETTPSWSLGAKRIGREDVAFRQSVSPRPGAHDYDVNHEHVDLARGKSPKYSMRSKCDTKARSQSPAPGTYESPGGVGKAHPVAKHCPMCNFGNAHRDNVAGRIMSYYPTSTPSPQEYNVARNERIGRVDQKEEPAYSMGASRVNQSDPKYRQSRSPRPSVNDYEVTHDHVNLMRKSAPKFSMRPRSAMRDRNPPSPGPGCYETVGALDRARARSSSPMSRGQRSGSKSACGFGGSSKRFQATKPDSRVYTY